MWNIDTLDWHWKAFRFRPYSFPVFITQCATYIFISGSSSSHSKDALYGKFLVGSFFPDIVYTPLTLCIRFISIHEYVAVTVNFPATVILYAVWQANSFSGGLLLSCGASLGAFLKWLIQVLNTLSLITNPYFPSWGTYFEVVDELHCAFLGFSGCCAWQKWIWVHVQLMEEHFKG